MKSKHRMTVIAIEHTKPINRRKIEDFLLKQGGKTVKLVTYKNAKIYIENKCIGAGNVEVKTQTK